MSRKNRLYVDVPRLKMLEGITLSFNGMTEKLGKQPSAAMLDELLAKHYPGFKLDADLREAILKALRKNNYNRTETARELAISRRALTYKLQRLRAAGTPVDVPTDGPAV